MGTHRALPVFPHIVEVCGACEPASSLSLCLSVSLYLAISSPALLTHPPRVRGNKTRENLPTNIVNDQQKLTHAEPHAISKTSTRPMYTVSCDNNRPTMFVELVWPPSGRSRYNRTPAKPLHAICCAWCSATGPNSYRSHAWVEVPANTAGAGLFVAAQSAYSINDGIQQWRWKTPRAPTRSSSTAPSFLFEPQNLDRYTTSPQLTLLRATHDVLAPLSDPGPRHVNGQGECSTGTRPPLKPT